ncbi:MAG: hypothetical protein K2K74_15265 [Lachnospiraceae bacterium]|nr:hypothetical protein [Lachnospiraceae bacterium]
MILKCTSFEQMNKEITERDMSIVVFGAGVIGTVTVPEILKQYGLWSRVLFYVDNNCRERRKMMHIGNKEVDVEPVDRLGNVGENTTVIIAISRYVEALEQLEDMPCTNHMTGYLMPIMCIHNFCSSISGGLPSLENKPLIPKKIHYIWLGKKTIPDNLQKCIDSWKRYCPDYDIIQWDESNYDVTKNDYMKQAYEAGAYGFVPDYARLDILYQYGGIYMDTDVEVIKSLDGMLYQQAFCGVEKWQTINFGGCSGAVKGHKAIRKMLDDRENVSFLCEDGSQNRTTCGFYDTSTALRNGYVMNGKTQNIMGMNIYAFDYFHPYDYMSGQTFQTRNTYTIHQFNGGWMNEGMRQGNEKAAREYNRIYCASVKNQ